MLKNLHYAILSGSCASAASTFGKLYGLPMLQDHLILRIVSFAFMVTCNAGVWTCFVKALQHSDSLTATVVSSTTNYSLSVIVGFLLFGETTSIIWWSGMGFIVIGLLLLLSRDSQFGEEDEKKTT